MDSYFQMMKEKILLVNKANTPRRRESDVKLVLNTEPMAFDHSSFRHATDLGDLFMGGIFEAT